MDMSSMLSLNFSTGMSVIYLTDVLRHEQLQEARKRIQNEKKYGEGVIANLKDIKKSLSACVGSMEPIGLGRAFLR